MFEVLEKDKCGNSLTVLLYKLERERLVSIEGHRAEIFFEEM